MTVPQDTTAARASDEALPVATERIVKQVIIIRRDLKMRRGKEIAQGAHAAMAWLCLRLTHTDETGTRVPSVFTPPFSDAERQWLAGSFTKVTCQVSSEEELRELLALAQATGIEAHLVTDRGLTEFGGVPTVTALGIGPDWSGRVDLVTGTLALY